MTNERSRMRVLVEPYLEERERLDAQWQALDVARGLDRLDRAYWRRVWEEREAETRAGTRELADGWVELLKQWSRLEEERRRFEEERRVWRRAVRVVWGWVGSLREWWWRWGWRCMLGARAMAPPGPRTYIAI